MSGCKISPVVLGANEVNHAGIKDWKNLVDRVSTKWRAGTLEVLQAHNKELIVKLDSLESQIDSLLRIERDHNGLPKELKKDWRDVLDKYEQVVNCAIAFAARYLDAEPNVNG
jgi:hypothetical protein